MKNASLYYQKKYLVIRKIQIHINVLTNIPSSMHSNDMFLELEALGEKRLDVLYF